MKTSELKSRLGQAFAWERVICRIITSWCSFAAVNLFNGYNFFDLSYAHDTSLLRVVIISALFFIVYSAASILLSNFESDSWYLLISSTVCVVRWLMCYAPEENQYLFLFAVIAVYTLFVLYFIRKNEALFDKIKLTNKAVIIIAVICGGVSCFVIALTTCLRHAVFATPNFDFGLFVNMFHNMKETGLPLVTSERDVLLSHFAVHISPIYYLLLPFYFVFPSPLTLQIGQAVLVSSGIIPTLLLCRHFKLSNKATAAVAFIYSFYPVLSAACLYDIHENCFLVPLLLWMFYFFEKEKYPLMYLFAILTFAVKEDAAIYVIIFAVFIIFSRKKFLHGIILAAGAVAYFCLALSVLSQTGAYYAELYADATPNPPINGPMINRFNNLIFDSEDGLKGALQVALTNPGYLLTQLFTEEGGGYKKLVYFVQMLLPLGFLPFCTKKVSRWLLIAPILMNMLTYYPYQYDIGFQYHFGVSAFLIYAFVMNINEIKTPTKKTLISIGAVACCCIYVFSVLPSLNTYMSWYNSNHKIYANVEEKLDAIPEDASVAASTFLVSHLADRSEIYQTAYHGTEPDVDFVVLDARYESEVKKTTIYIFRGYNVVYTMENRLIILVRNDSKFADSYPK